jgi:hypothetical protein
MGTNTLVNGIKICERAKGFKKTLKVTCTRESGNRIWNMAREDSNPLMGLFTRANGIIVTKTDTAWWSAPMVISIRAIGKMTNFMEKVLVSYLIVLNVGSIGSMDKSSLALVKSKVISAKIREESSNDWRDSKSSFSSELSYKIW